MDTDSIPEHHFRCDTCGALVDMRELAQVVSHDMINLETGKKYCRTPEQIKQVAQEIGPITSRKVGEPVEWRDGKPTNIN